MMKFNLWDQRDKVKIVVMDHYPWVAPFTDIYKVFSSYGKKFHPTTISKTGKCPIMNVVPNGDPIFLYNYVNSNLTEKWQAPPDLGGKRESLISIL